MLNKRKDSRFPSSWWPPVPDLNPEFEVSQAPFIFNVTIFTAQSITSLERFSHSSPLNCLDFPFLKALLSIIFFSPARPINLADEGCLLATHPMTCWNSVANLRSHSFCVHTATMQAKRSVGPHEDDVSFSPIQICLWVLLVSARPVSHLRPPRIRPCHWRGHLWIREPWIHDECRGLSYMVGGTRVVA